jgi:hypothetical protein
MAPLSRAHSGTANAALESFGAARTAVTPKSELALTALVVMALVAGTAIVSIAALAKQTQYSNADWAMSARAGAMNGDAFNKAEAEVLDRDLSPFCLNIGGNKLPSTPGRQTLGRDDRIFKGLADSAFAHESLAAAKEDQAIEGSTMIPPPAAAAARRPQVGSVARISDLGCSVRNYK